MTEYYVPLLKVTFCMHHQIKKKKNVVSQKYHTA